MQAQVCEQQYSGCSNSHGKPTATHPAQIVDVEIGVTVAVYIHCQYALHRSSCDDGLTATTGAAVVIIVVVALGLRLKQLHAEEISPAAYAFNAGGAPRTPSSGTALRLGAATLGQLESVTWVNTAGAVVVLCYGQSDYCDCKGLAGLRILCWCDRGSDCARGRNLEV
jgi:hypothetical protein